MDNMDPLILIIDDNPATRKLLRLTLEGEHYRVSEADSATTGLSAVPALRPGLIVQDLHLPDMDGLDLIKRLRALPEAAAIPILCYSGEIVASDRSRMVAAGFTDILMKPSSAEGLIETVRAYL